MQSTSDLDYLIDYLDDYIEEYVDKEAMDIDFTTFYEDFLLYMHREHALADPGYNNVLRAFKLYIQDLAPELKLDERTHRITYIGGGEHE